jgi:hypothetical protein
MILSLPPYAACKYRIETATSKPPIVLIRKRCACGARVFAKQLVQYGRCEKCARAVA